MIKISPQATHCAVVNAMSVNGKPSILLFESARPYSNSSGILAFNIRLAALLNKSNFRRETGSD
ncbi:MAG: hypothetical protein EKE20_00005, partial [Candidatus Symbiopectobacterium sp. Dall1.0]|nr:hypothetical protein [Candidatus Symbiopectobacterium sp. Dall1.0]